MLSGKVKEAVLESKGLHSASVFSNFISMLFYWGKKTEIIKFTSEGHCEDGRRLGMGSAKNTLRDIYYISALLSSFCVLCFLASPPSKKPEQAITHPETFLKLSIGCLRYCSVDFSVILSCLVQEKHFLISKYNRFTSLPRVRSTFPLSHRKRFMSHALSPPPHG